MKVDKELILKVAKNARLKLTGNEIEEFLPQLKDILDNFEKIKNVDTSNVKEIFHPIEIKNNFRKDIVEKSLTQDEALSNTKHKKDGYFKGPKAI